MKNHFSILIPLLCAGIALSAYPGQAEEVIEDATKQQAVMKFIEANYPIPRDDSPQSKPSLQPMPETISSILKVPPNDSGWCSIEFTENKINQQGEVVVREPNRVLEEAPDLPQTISAPFNRDISPGEITILHAGEEGDIIGQQDHESTVSSEDGDLSFTPTGKPMFIRGRADIILRDILRTSSSVHARSITVVPEPKVRTHKFSPHKDGQCWFGTNGRGGLIALDPNLYDISEDEAISQAPQHLLSLRTEGEISTDEQDTQGADVEAKITPESEQRHVILREPINHLSRSSLAGSFAADAAELDSTYQGAPTDRPSLPSSNQNAGRTPDPERELVASRETTFLPGQIVLRLFPPLRPVSCEDTRLASEGLHELILQKLTGKAEATYIKHMPKKCRATYLYRKKVYERILKA